MMRHLKHTVDNMSGLGFTGREVGTHSIRSSLAMALYLKKRMVCVYEGKKTFKCNICAASFAQKEKLKTHVTSVHEMKKPFKCNICDTSFVCKRNLNQHVASVHEAFQMQCLQR